MVGSPCNTKVGLERRTCVFKHAIQLLNDGDLSNKVSLPEIYILITNNLNMLAS